MCFWLVEVLPLLNSSFFIYLHFWRGGFLVLSSSMLLSCWDLGVDQNVWKSEVNGRKKHNLWQTCGKLCSLGRLGDLITLYAYLWALQFLLYLMLAFHEEFLSLSLFFKVSNMGAERTNSLSHSWQKKKKKNKIEWERRWIASKIIKRK